TTEPYRMFTSRAEYRILLRQDNADLRLTEIGHKIGLADEHRVDAVNKKKQNVESLLLELKKLKLGPEDLNHELTLLNTSPIREKVNPINLMKRPEIGIVEMKTRHPSIDAIISAYSPEEQEQAEIHLKYESYIEREQKLAEKIGSLDTYVIKRDFDYDRVKALSHEAREKLKKTRPETLGQATRISGVSP